MSKTDNLPEDDKAFNRKANALTPMSVSGKGSAAKFAVFTENLEAASLKRQASGPDFLGAADPGGSSRVPIMYVDPMFDPILLMFPKENLKELNRRLRHYYSFHPIVRNLINLHSTFPFGDMEVRGEDKQLEPYWQSLSEKLNLTQMIVHMSRDYELLGECHKPTTKILMADGSTKAVKDVKAMDEVITECGLPCRVKCRTSKQVSERLVGISLDGKSVSWMTANHPVLTVIPAIELRDRGAAPNGRRVQHHDHFEFVRADALRAGSLVAIPKEIFIIGNKEPISIVPPGVKSVGCEDGKLLFEIRAIKHRKYSGKVYSMEIDGDPTYIADGIVVHNSFHVGNWDDSRMEWENFHQYPPENVEVHKIYAGSGVAYFLKPDDELRKMLNSSKEIDRAIIDMLPQEFKEHVAEGKPIHLDNNRVIHYANKSAGYLTRGESPLKAALKYLLAEDKLYMLMLVFIDRHMFPMKIWKIGSKEQKWLPSRKHFDMLKQKLIEAKGDPDYDLVYHAFLDMEYKTGATQHEDLIKWFDWTQKRILIALFANEAMFAEANPYAKEAMSVKLIMHRYMLQRATINNIVTNKIWLPVAMKRDYIIRSNSEVSSNISNDKMHIPEVQRYSVPKLFWRPSNLVSGMQEQEYLLKMREKGDLPAEVIYDLLGLDINKVKAALHQEQHTPIDPMWRKAREELLKDPKVRNEAIKGTKMRDIEIPAGLAGPAEGPAGAKPPSAPGGLGGAPAAPGRPKLPEDKKSKPEKALIPPDVMGPREKQQEKGELPSPKGEDMPPL